MQFQKVKRKKLPESVFVTKKQNKKKTKKKKQKKNQKPKKQKIKFFSSSEKNLH